MAGYKVKTRHGPRLERETFADLDAALAGVEQAAQAILDGPPAETVKPPLMREFEPVHQVLGRVELSGPRRLAAGVDVRGDGSMVAFTGRLRRALVEPRDGESAVAALRRTLRDR
jgi:hypothetical protein